MNHAWRRRILGGALVLALAAAPGAAQAEDEGDALYQEAGVGALAALSTLVYGPVKLVYATAGLLIGGVAWGLSGGDGEVLTAVVTPSVRGDYVVTPQHVRMQRGIEFFGRHPRYRSVEPGSVARTPSSSPPETVSSAPLDAWGEPIVEEDY